MCVCVCACVRECTCVCVCVRERFHSLSVQFEDAAHEAADELTQPRPEGEEHVEDIQVLLKSDANPIQIRDLRVCYVKNTLLFTLNLYIILFGSIKILLHMCTSSKLCVKMCALH